MSEAAPAPGALLTRIVADFCVPMVAGGVIGEAPARSVELSEAQRVEIGLSQPGRTLCCASSAGPVFVDAAGDRSQTWFVHPDARTALAAFQRELQRVHPSARQVSDLPHQDTPKRRVRFFLADLGGGRTAQIEAGYPAPGCEGPENDLFLVRVFAMLIADPALLGAVPPQAPAPPAGSGKPKKKGWFG